MNINFDITLTNKQKEVYNLIHKQKCKYLVARFSRQSGKSVLAEILLIEYLCKGKTFNVYISPTFSQGRKVFKEIRNLLAPTGLIKNANASTLTVETINGSQLQFFSMENPNAIRGYTVNGLCVMDETAFMPDTTSDGSDPWSSILMPILKANRLRNKVLIISTPKGKRGMFWEFHNKCLMLVEGWYEVAANIYDDSLVSAEEIEEIKSNISEIAFREEFLVEFLDSSQTFFSGYENCFKDFRFCFSGSHWVGVDYSANGKDKTVVTVINERNEVDSITVTGSLDEKYIKISNIINEIPNLKGVLMENNGVGSPMINEVRKKLKAVADGKTKEWVTTNRSKVEILSFLATKIAKKELVFQSADTQLYSQFGTFITKYTKKGTMQLEASSGNHDDKIMSLAIALKCKNDSDVLGNYNISFLRH